MTAPETTDLTEASPKAKPQAKSRKANAKPKASKGGGETKRDKFKRIAGPRMDAALKKISLLGNLAGSGYDYESSEAKQMVAALVEAVDEVAQKLARKPRAGKGGSGFSFK